MQACRFKPCSTATVEDLSIAISSASLGKMVAIKGLDKLGVCKVGLLICIVVVLFVGWLREIESSLPDAERVYSDCEVEESKQMISAPASRSSLEQVRSGFFAMA